MKRICILKATKRIYEMQGGGDDRPELMEARLNTLKQNAINAGHLEADIEVKWVTNAEYEAAKAEDPNEIAAQADAAAKEAEQAAKAQVIIDNLPSREIVKTAVNNIANLAGAKAFLMKLTDVVYWLAKNKAD